MDNNNNIIAPLTVRPVNQHDSVLLPESLEKLIDIADWLLLDIENSHITFDSGFDSEYNKRILTDEKLIPVIMPNPRNSKREKRYVMLDEFETVRHIYKERYRIERNFAWKTKYRKLVIRYEKLQCTHLGFRYIAYAMVNSREIFGENI